MSKEDDSVAKWILAIPIIVVVMVLYLLVSVYRINQKAADELPARQASYQQYLLTHQCVVTGYAGKHAMEIYQCEHGMLLSRDIWTQIEVKEIRDDLRLFSKDVARH
jgi:hypothetical protein